jgi:type IV pilus assembly protein PilB
MDHAFEIGILSALVRMKALSAENAASIEKSFHESDIDQLDEFLLHEGLVDEENLLQALSDYFQVPSFDVVGYFFERHYVRMFPKDILLRYSMVPLEVDENILVMVTSRPSDQELLFEIGQYVSYDIQFYVGIGRDIQDAVKEFYDRADTEDFTHEGEELTEEQILTSEFQFLEEEGEEGLIVLVDEDAFE